MRRVPIGGQRYFRVAEQGWNDPLDPTYAALDVGRRWNPPGVPCLYVNVDRATAQANFTRRFEGEPFGPELLSPANGPDLVPVMIPESTGVDAFTDAGLVEIGLPITYPRDDNGEKIGWEPCQEIAKTAILDGLDGIDARSAATGGPRELAWYPHGRTPVADGPRESFVSWYGSA
jgi:hypothetical protein